MIDINYIAKNDSVFRIRYYEKSKIQQISGKANELDGIKFSKFSKVCLYEFCYYCYTKHDDVIIVEDLKTVEYISQNTFILFISKNRKRLIPFELLEKDEIAKFSTDTNENAIKKLNDGRIIHTYSGVGAVFQNISDYQYFEDFKNGNK